MLSYLSTPALLYVCCLTALIGLVFGSGLHCLAWRLAHPEREERWSSGSRSHCPSCGHVLYANDLVPLFSWLALKGRCRYCGEKIPARYPISEMILAGVFLSLLWRFGLSRQFFQLAVLCCCLFTLSIVDLDTLTIPDRFLVIPFAVRIICQLYFGGIPAAWYSLWHGLILGGSVLAVSLLMDRVLGRESMGGGDIKLLFVLGCYFDLIECMFLLITACIIGMLSAIRAGRGQGIAFSFGPSLSMAAWLTMMVGREVSAWYLGLF